jgi:hypothetical protein
MVVLYGLLLIILNFLGCLVVRQPSLHVLCEESDPICVGGALAILFFDTVVYYLHDTGQVGSAIVINSSIFLQRGLSVPSEDLIAFHLTKPITVSITIIAFLEDGVELQVDWLSGHELALGKGLILLL